MKPVTRSAIGVHHTATAEGEWDGPANKRRVRSPEEVGYFRRIFAWRDTERDGDRKDHYRFIHHFVSEDGTPGNASTVGCQAGIGVLNGARGGTTIPDADQQGVYNHLAAHLRDADIEPAELRAEAVSEHSLMSADEFQDAVLRDMVPEHVLLRKQFVAEVKASEDHKGLYEFTISTATIDRDGDRIAADGWDFRNFMRNPVVLWAHDYRSLPIGRAVDLFIESDFVKALMEFASAELYPFAEQVRQFYEQKFLRAVSVGFLPLKWVFAEENGRFGIDFEQQELLEFSGVPVPANPQALLNSVKNVAQKEALEQTLRELFNVQFLPEMSVEKDPRASLALRRRRLELERTL